MYSMYTMEFTDSLKTRTIIICIIIEFVKVTVLTAVRSITLYMYMYMYIYIVIEAGGLRSVYKTIVDDMVILLSL